MTNPFPILSTHGFRIALMRGGFWVCVAANDEWANDPEAE